MQSEGPDGCSVYYGVVSSMCLQEKWRIVLQLQGTAILIPIPLLSAKEVYSYSLIVVD